MVGPGEDNQERMIEEAVQRFVDAQLQGQKPDIDEYIGRYPGLEHQIRQRIQNLERIGALFARLTQADESDFSGTTEQSDLVGTKLRNFEVLREIGRGGMGRVYLAQDTKLDRSVAIKSIPPELACDSKARARLQREATLLASLNHPNIAIIHELIEQDPDAGYLVLEYIQGQTLAERIKNKPIKLKEALLIALQIAEGVAAAHEHDVIHRDLKPGNIKITPEGSVKILDFGLAKPSDTQDERADSVITQPGRIVGTPAYMSPEQARGSTIDHRTDIWSFGCVIYEMLTGRLPFEGETATDTVARILERQPDWQALPQLTPVNIRVLLRRCLEKDPRRRLQHIGDAAIEINETLNVPPNEPPLGVPEDGKLNSANWKSSAIYCAAGFIIGIMAVCLILGNSATSPKQSVRPTQRSVILLPEDQTLALSRSGPLGWAHPSITLSPDGSHLVYVASIGETTQLFVRSMNEYQAKSMPGTEGAFCPFFSPDGRWVGFLTNDKLKKVSILGGNPEILCDARNPRGGSWGDDETICFGESQGISIAQIPASGGTAIYLVPKIESDDKSIYQYNKLEILPGSKWVLFSGNGNIGVVCPETGEQKLLDEKGYYARYLPTGHLVYARAGVIVTAPFDLATLRVTGDSVPVLENVLLDSGYNTVQYTFSRNGLLVYVPGGDTSRCIPVWVNRQNKTEPLPMPVQIYGTPKLSPDGTRLAIEVKAGAKQDIYIYDIATGRSTRLTLKGSNISPVWTPDGRRVTFLRYMEGQEKWSLFWKPVDGGGNAELLYSSQYDSVPCSWSPDGNRLAFFGKRPTTKGDVWVLSLEGAREPECIIATEFTEWAPAFSPDGRYIAYTSDKDGKFQVYVCPYPDNDWVRLISDDFGEEPIWSPEGDELFYRNGDKWMVVSTTTEPEFTAGTPRVLFEGPFNNVSGISYDVAPDGQRFLVLQPQYDDSQVRELHVVVNWFEELKRLAKSQENR